MLSNERNEQVCELAIISMWINIRKCVYGKVLFRTLHQEFVRHK